jgi:hypothetical protein
VRRFELALPDTLAACQQALADGPDVRLVAGGTDLLPQMKNGLVKARRVVDLSQLHELKVIERLSNGGLRVGAGVSARTLELAQQVRDGFTSLAESASVVGSLQIRHLATLGGNLANAAPSADMAPPLLALDAEFLVAGPRGQRRVAATEFFVGVRRTQLAADEMLVEIIRTWQWRHIRSPYASARTGHRRGRRCFTTDHRRGQVRQGAHCAGGCCACTTPGDGGRSPTRRRGSHAFLNRGGGSAGSRGVQSDFRSARVRRLPAPPGARPDPPYAHNRARARNRPVGLKKWSPLIDAQNAADLHDQRRGG